ncbi:OLC1v1012408C1 [Oldenlandia corymbosa var. corymbosa]|uniref:OLC1v1012408C1 n=1 Tax=Oldenlandia corymbosa var. corymbosa TaxID=529605 RepID=A0AAV1DZ89_OLDCO|nr:OLC1v1012408C1 [Oldenlandia corymbosa var. corymbosa]
MEEHSRIPMGKTVRILRRSVYTFLQKYQSFTTTAAILALPYAALVLLSESAIPSSALLQGIHNRLQSLFDAAGFPRSSDFFAILNIKLSQTIATSYLIFPFIFTFFLFTKAFVIHTLSNNRKPVSRTPFAFFNSLFGPLFYTQICNMILMISANATCFCILFIAFNCADGLGLVNPKTLLIFSATGAVLYSIVLANSLIICNLALIVSGMENSSGYIAILKACVLIRGRTATALSLALPVNLALAALEALFQYRIIRAIHESESPFHPLFLKGYS